MDSPRVFMDIPLTDMGHLPRAHPSRLPVLRFGQIAGRQNWRHYASTSMNCSFVLSGAGGYRIDGQDIDLQMPCVITQWPDVPVAYGPLVSGEWREFYLNYPASAQAELEHAGLVDRSQPWWAIHDPTTCERLIAQILVERERIDQPGVVDRIDRLCERLVLESHLGAPVEFVPQPLQAVRRIRQHVDLHSHEAIDWERLAAEADLAWSTFRRWWQKEVRIPPTQYLTGLRLSHAERLLVESDDSIGAIAQEVGFEDPLYFSRRFTKQRGMSPRQFRNRYRVIEG